MNLVVTHADPSHLDAINAVIEGAKRSLGYDAAYLVAALPLLRVDADYLARCTCLEALLDGCVVGFAAVDWGEGDEAVLDHLWIAPEVQRQGIGRRLVEACMERAKERAVARLLIIADPPSEEFYKRLGATRVGTKASRVAAGPVFPVLLLERSGSG